MVPPTKKRRVQVSQQTMSIAVRRPRRACRDPQPKVLDNTPRNEDSTVAHRPNARSQAVNRQNQPSPESIEQVKNPLPENTNLTLTIDTGTTNIRSNYCVLPSSKELSANEVFESDALTIQNSTQYASIAAVEPPAHHKDAATLATGPTVGQLRRSGRIGNEHTMEDLKFCMLAEAFEYLVMKHQKALSTAGRLVLRSKKPSLSGKPIYIKSGQDAFKDVVRVYFGEVCNEIQSRKSWTAQFMEEVVRSRMRVVATVPKIWDSATIDNFANAFRQAGIHNLTIRVDSKCVLAAIAQKMQNALRSIKNGNHRDDAMLALTKRTQLVIDIGGGTVNCTAGRIEQTIPEIRISILTRGVGSWDGGHKLRDIFREHLRVALQPYMADIIGHLARDAEFTEDAVLDAFEMGAKESSHGFEGRNSGMVDIPFEGFFLPSELDPTRMTKRVFMMTSGEVQKVFDEWLQPTLELVDAQVEKFKKSKLEMHLVGGGSQPPYVRKVFEKRYGSRPRVTFQVSHEIHKSLVTQGAMLLSLSPEMEKLPHTRRAYGCALYTEFEEGKHDPKYRKPALKWAEEDEMFEAVFWGILRNTDITKGRQGLRGSIHIPQKDLKDRKGDMVLELDIHSTEDDQLARDESDDGRYNPSHPHIRKEGTLKIRIPRKDCQFPLVQPKDAPENVYEPYYDVDFFAYPRWEERRFICRFMIPKRGKFAEEFHNSNNDPQPYLIGIDCFVEDQELLGATRWEDIETLDGDDGGD